MELLATQASSYNLLKEIYHHPDELIAVDTETTGKDFIKDGRHYAIGVSFAKRIGDKLHKGYVAIEHPGGGNDPDRLVGALTAALSRAKLIGFQNVKFDMHSLLTQGIELHPDLHFYDAASIANMLDDNVWEHRSMDLDALADHYLKRTVKFKDEYVEKEKKTGNQHITGPEEREYAEDDAAGTLEVTEALIDRLEDAGLTELWTYKMRLLKLLFKMERRGARIHQRHVRELISEGEAEMARLLDEIGVNPKSPTQLKTLLIDELHLPVLAHTPKGAPSFTTATMAEYEPLLEKLNSPLAKHIVAYRGWQTALGLTLKPFLEKVSPDGRLRTNFNLHQTVTGRLSSSGPNLQQVPKDGDKPWKAHTKSVLVPEDGYVLVNADFSQLELRLATVYADEPSLRKVFKEGRDIFAEMSKEMGPPFTRDLTKRFVYLTQYGGGPNKVKNVFGVSVQQAKSLLDRYHRRYKGFAKFNTLCEQTAKDRMSVKIWSGRSRHFSYRGEARKAMNSVIQGGAADIVERVMLALEAAVDDDVECRMLLQVHDAVVFEIREDLVDEYVPLIKNVMEDVVGATGRADFGVTKFAVDVKPDYGSKGWTNPPNGGG